MIRHAWSVVCEKVIIDQTTNNVSLDVLEQMNLEGVVSLPLGQGFLVPTRVEVVSLWYRDPSGGPDNGRARVRLIAPGDEKELGLIEYALDLSVHERARTRGSLPAFPLVGSGTYYFLTEQKVDEKWNEVARIPLQVEAQTVQPSAPTVAATLT